MTEAQWLVSDDPEAMLRVIGAWDYEGTPRTTERKLRLFACACSRHAWRRLRSKRRRKAVEVAERFADGLAGESALDRASSEAIRAPKTADQHPLWMPVRASERPVDLMSLLRNWQGEPCRDIEPNPPAAAFLRDIVGNP